MNVRYFYTLWILMTAIFAKIVEKRNGGEIMKKRNTMLGMGLLIAVLVLGIGYAFTAIDLTIGGTVNVSPDASNFKVLFSAAEAANTKDSATITDSDTNSITGEIIINSLVSVGDTATVTFTVKNDSDAGIGAVINKPVINKTTNGEYFEVTTDWDSADTTTIPSVTGNTKDLVVTVKLVKAPVDADIEGKFTVTLTANADAE